jgi:hypothetical protein
MTEERMALAELVQKAGEGDFLRAVAEAVLQVLMEADVELSRNGSGCRNVAQRRPCRGKQAGGR